MKAKELKSKSKKELTELLKESENKLFKLRLQKQQAQLKNVKEIGTVRKDIARIKMMLHNQQNSK
jgi:large subunit ribosomal protein L29